jgi:hypothetical protein
MASRDRDVHPRSSAHAERAVRQVSKELGSIGQACSPMGLSWILAIIVLVLLAAALVKYLLFGKSR